ncbi:hypothetical protein HCH52_08625 [Oscillospiraceae bacterium HV4-5-C5C]|nr:hypothetical protein [Oscillospiraceae bacterium HV4-5-C5C]
MKNAVSHHRLGELYKLWLLLATDAFFILLLWLISPAYLLPLSGLILLFSGLTGGLWLVLSRLQNRRQLSAWQNWVRQPDQDHLLKLRQSGSSACHPALLALLQTQRQQLEQNQQQQQADQQFVELWAHEIKTSLALLGLLQNHYQSQLPTRLDLQLQQIQQRMNQSVNRMLYYSRLTDAHPDVRLRRLDLT